MNNDFLDQLEQTNITLETIAGLAAATSDLLENDPTLLTEYPSDQPGAKYKANRLIDKLMALSAATATMTKKAQHQLSATLKQAYDNMNHK